MSLIAVVVMVVCAGQPSARQATAAMVDATQATIRNN